MAAKEERAALHSNRLVHQTSPYLLQHAHNPVDWYPWGEEALQHARATNRLLLISVGYSSCHWCHVMERECFENEAIAQVMNAHFVCIKVDREERPDVDQVYMSAVQLLTGRGGWPLNCFALPDGRPIYGGTYFPPAQWEQVLKELHSAWHTDPQRVERAGEKLQLGVVASSLVDVPTERISLDQAMLDDLIAAWEVHFDREHGGPDRAPKFPMPNNHLFLLRQGQLSGNKVLLDQVELTLDKMALGGIFDQVGGGFARYSTDLIWKVPHFEKMLYDNAQLVVLYSEAFQHFKKPLYRHTVERALDFLERELTAANGLFHSALDADTEGEEGRFYVWSKDELQTLLGAEFDLAAAYFNINSKGLWEEDRYILLRTVDDPEMARTFGISEAELEERISAIRSTLLHARDQRQRPGLDDKCLTSWNALMISGLCAAHNAFQRDDLRRSAERTMTQLLSLCKRTDGGLWRSTKNGASTINGYLDDHAFTIEALIDLYQITFNEAWLTEAQALMEHTIRHFSDTTTGLFHYTSDLDPPLIARPMELHDNVTPASNSSMAKGLYLLGELLDHAPYRKRSKRMLETIAPTMASYPSGHSNWALLAQWQTYPMPQIAITGTDALALRQQLAAYPIPQKLLLGGTLEATLPLLHGKFLPSSTIFVCVDKTCSLPVATVPEALSQLP